MDITGYTTFIDDVIISRKDYESILDALSFLLNEFSKDKDDLEARILKTRILDLFDTIKFREIS